MIHILGILRSTSRNREYNWSWKVRPYEDIIRSIQYLKTPAEAVQETKAEKHAHLWMILRNKMKIGHYLLQVSKAFNNVNIIIRLIKSHISYHITTNYIVQFQLRSWDPLNFASIFDSMLLITNDVEIDAYYLSHGLWSCLNERHSVEAINDLVNFYHKTLSNNRNTSKLYR